MARKVLQKVLGSIFALIAVGAALLFLEIALSNVGSGRWFEYIFMVILGGAAIGTALTARAFLRGGRTSKRETILKV